MNAEANRGHSAANLTGSSIHHQRAGVPPVFRLTPTGLAGAVIVLGIDSLLPLLDDAVAVQQQSNGTTTTFSATMSPQTLAGLDRSQLPPGLAMITATSSAEVPADISLEGTAIDGVLSTITIQIAGETSAGPIQASITTTLSGLGRPQSVNAPAADLLLDVEQMESRDELIEGGANLQAVDEMFDQFAVMDDLGDRRPCLCLNLTGSMAEGILDEEDIQKIVTENRALATCYRESGEPAAAAVIGFIAGGWQRALDQTTTLADVEQRSPGLCAEHTTFKGDLSHEQYVQRLYAHAECLAEAGELAAANAVQATAEQPPLMLPWRD